MGCIGNGVFDVSIQRAESSAILERGDAFADRKLTAAKPTMLYLLTSIEWAESCGLRLASTTLSCIWGCYPALRSAACNVTPGLKARIRGPTQKPTRSATGRRQDGMCPIGGLYGVVY